MQLSDFNFNLPSELIAQVPALSRDDSRLLIHSNSNSSQSNNIIKFAQLVDYLRPGDLVVCNNSKVINAKLLLRKKNKIININLNKPIDTDRNIWLAFAKPARKLDIGEEFIVGPHKIIIKEKRDWGEIIIEFILYDTDIFTFLHQNGMVPLPQYIKRVQVDPSDVERYQNIYSTTLGSVAAPTAGLHFTSELIDKIQAKGVDIVFITLHVGAGTFLPVKTENIHDHKMHYERCELTPTVADKINQCKKEGRRIITVGTTTMRTLESCAKAGIVYAQSLETNIFIKPGYSFQIADALITNFHLPKSTLFMLVCAFAGINETKDIYQYAIDHKMRFFSYGDAMFVEKINKKY